MERVEELLLTQIEEQKKILAALNAAYKSLKTTSPKPKVFSSKKIDRARVIINNSSSQTDAIKKIASSLRIKKEEALGIFNTLNNAETEKETSGNNSPIESDKPVEQNTSAQESETPTTDLVEEHHVQSQDDASQDRVASPVEEQQTQVFAEPEHEQVKPEGVIESGDDEAHVLEESSSSELEDAKPKFTPHKTSKKKSSKKSKKGDKPSSSSSSKSDKSNKVKKASKKAKHAVHEA